MSTNLTPVRANDLSARERSSRWPAVRLRFLVTHPTCAACGRRKQLNVHHVTPFHVEPSKELDPHNLITLCEEGIGGANCHLLFGHCGDWKDFNRAVRRDARHNLHMIANRVET